MDFNKKRSLILERFYNTHNNCDCYNFDKFNYTGVNKHSIVICEKLDKNGKKHGEFEITPANLNSQKNICPKCYKENCSKNVTLSNDNFIEKLQNIYGDIFDYSKIEYKHNKIPVTLICKKHNYEFESKPCNLTRGFGICPLCKKEKQQNKHKVYFNNLIQKLKNKPYDFSKSEYINSTTKIKIYCNSLDKYGEKHGEFYALPTELLNGKGCPKCAGNHHKTTEEFIKDAKSIHGDKYDYSKVEYINQGEKVCIICQKHGEFWMTPNKHLSSKQGCPLCKESKLEIDIANFLEENNINFKRQKHFKWLGQKSLDFYLPDQKLAIECQGEQHFTDIKYFDSVTLEKRIVLDELKFNECLEHGIKIIYYTTYRIPDTFVKKHVYLNNKEDILKNLI